MNRIIHFIIALFFISNAFAQRYWQQEVNYNIRVSLNDETNTLTAFEEIEYINNSPYTLEHIYMHLWPNAYKDNHTAFARQKVRDGSNEFYFADEYDRGWIESLDFEVNGEAVAWLPDEKYIDIAKIILKKPLKSGEKISIKTPFKVKLPKTFSRLGHVNQSYQITQWYPKPAVFDAAGWHPMPYLDQGEFYSEFGSFEVAITLPENYVVGATGVLQNEGEKDWMLERVKLSVPESKYIESSSTTKTLVYKQDKIHDFAWFADKNYNIAKGEVELPNSKKIVDCWYMYTSRFKNTRKEGLEDIINATYYYSKYVGDYPYSSVTAVTGALGAGGGMEYPMITVTDPSAIVHEVGHNWFYGILGSNERDNGWLDEGLNSFFEEKIYRLKVLKDSSDFKQNSIQAIFSDTYKLTSEFLETRNLNQPVHCTSNGYHTANYFVQLYQKPVMLMRYLEEFLGEEVFLQCFHAYYEKWKFKHPHIEDMQEIFEKESGKDLNWLFRTIIKNNVSPQVRIARMKKNKRGFDATFLSENNTPIKVNLLDDDKEVMSSKWVEFKHGKTSVYYHTEAKKLSIDNKNIIFSSSSDKFIRKNGPFKRLRVPQLNLGFPRNKVNRSGAGLTPSIGMNTTDGFLAGVVLYNTGIRSNKINYTLVPMYGIKSGEIKGLATINHYYYPKRDFYVVETGLVAQQFANYSKYGLNVSHWSKIEMFDISWNNKMKLRNSFVTTTLSDSINSNNIFSELKWELYHKDAVREIKFYPTLGLYLDENMHAAVKTSLEVFGSYNFTRNDNISLRMFTGTFTELDAGASYFFGLSNGLDYAKDYYNYDRAGLNVNPIHSNGQDGGFRAYEAIAASWMTTFNLTADIPKVPFSVYSDVGFLPNDFKWGTGLSLNIYEDMIEFYFPIAGTNYVDTTPTDGIDFFNNMRVMLKLPLKSSNEVIWDKI